MEPYDKGMPGQTPDDQKNSGQMPWGRHGYGHYQSYFILRLLIMIVIAVLIFAFGYFIGSHHASGRRGFYGNGYMRHYPGPMTRAYPGGVVNPGGPLLPPTSTVSPAHPITPTK